MSGLRVSQQGWEIQAPMVIRPVTEATLRGRTHPARVPPPPKVSEGCGFGEARLARVQRASLAIVAQLIRRCLDEKQG